MSATIQNINSFSNADFSVTYKLDTTDFKDWLCSHLSSPLPREYKLRCHVSRKEKRTKKKKNVKANLILFRTGFYSYLILGSIVVSIPTCHAGDGGSIPRLGDFFFYERRRQLSEIYFIVFFSSLSLSFLFFPISID